MMKPILALLAALLFAPLAVLHAATAPCLVTVTSVVAPFSAIFAGFLTARELVLKLVPPDKGLKGGDELGEFAQALPFLVK